MLLYASSFQYLAHSIRCYMVYVVPEKILFKKWRKAMYEWRHMTTKERAELLLARRSRKYPKHSPPHFEYNDTYCFHLCAANFEHQNIIGATPQRLAHLSHFVFPKNIFSGGTLYPPAMGNA